MYLGLLAEVEHLAGRSSEALAHLEEALRLAAASGERFYEAELLRVQGQVLAGLGPDRHEEAEASVRAAVLVAERQRAVTFAAQARSDLERLSAVRDG